MILAAGRGERMRPLTDQTPKPLLAVGGKPLIVWTIERLAKAGFRELIINHAHLGHHIEAHLGDGAAFGVTIRYSPEAQALETAGGIANALPLLGDSAFVVVNGDIYCDYDLRLAAAAAQQLGPDGDLLRLVLVANPAHHPGGDFALDGDRLRNTGKTMLTFTGIGAYVPSLFAGIRRGDKARLRPIIEAAMASGRAGGELHRGSWVDVGTPARLSALDAQLAAAAQSAVRA